MWLLLLASAACLPCHEEIVRSFAKTAMGRSISKPAAEAEANARGEGWSVLWNGKTMVHRVGTETRTVEWAVGSGHEGKSYLFRIGDALFQSPLSWYAKRGAWDLSPGFALGKSFDFLRPVTPDCLFCHAGASKPIAGTLNRYESISEPVIGCARCHGDSRVHLRDARRGNIVNPAKLPNRERDSVCEQCHLSGAARIPNPGMSFSDFRAGIALEDIFSVYVPAETEAFKVVSHVEQLALSRCSIASQGKLWCGGCHDPHREKTTARQQCETCHARQRTHGDDCAGCHMPRTNAHDGGHTAFTDHRIRKPGQAALTEGTAKGLRAWREPAPMLRNRGLGLAYAGIGELEKGYALLRNTSPDPDVQTALGLVHLRAERTGEALVLMEAAARAEPVNSVRRLNLAAALLAAGRRERAKAEALEAIRLEPLLLDAYVLLAEIEPRRATYWKAEFKKKRTSQK